MMPIEYWEQKANAALAAFVANSQQVTALWSAVAILAACVALLVAWGWVRAFGYSRRPVPRWRVYHWPWVPLAVALGYRLPLLNEPVWYDETFTAAMARVPMGDMFTAVLGDVHPPTWYALSHITTRITGDAPWALRLPAMLFGLGAVWLVYRLGRAIQASQAAAWWGSMIAAMLPAAVQYSNDARPYALLAFLVLAALVTLTERRWVLFSVVIAFLPITHNIGYVYFVLLYLLASYLAWSFRNIGILLLSIIPAAVWLPWMAHQSADIADGFWLLPLDLGSFLWPLVSMTATVRQPLAAGLWLYPLAVVVLVLGAVFSWPLWRPSGWPIVVVGVGVPVLLAMSSIAWHPVYLDRALLPLFFVACLAIAWVVAETNVSPLLAPLLAVFLVGAAWGYFHPGLARVDHGDILARCDQVYYTSVAGAMLGTYHHDGPHLLWPGANDLTQTLPDASKDALKFQQGIPTSGEWCLFELVLPHSSAGEMAHVSHMRYHHLVTFRQRVVHQFYTMRLYELSL